MVLRSVPRRIIDEFHTAVWVGAMTAAIVLVAYGFVIYDSYAKAGLSLISGGGLLALVSTLLWVAHFVVPQSTATLVGDVSASPSIHFNDDLKTTTTIKRSYRVGPIHIESNTETTVSRTPRSDDSDEKSDLVT